MQILQSTKDQLLKPLQAAVGVVERKHTLPILSNVLVHCQKGRAAFVATDLELQVTTWLDDISPADVSITVSARKVLDICRSLQEGVKLTMDMEDDQLKIKAGKSRFSLQTLPARDFPQLQLPEAEGVRFQIESERLRRLLGRVQFSMAVQDIRYYLNGMLFSINGARITVVATDGHRMAMDSLELEKPATGTLDVILPRKAVLELIKLMGDANTTLDVQLSANQVVFNHTDFELRSKVVDGKFPDYQRVIPVGHDKHFIVNRVLFNQALARASILTNEKFRSVRLAISNQNLRVICRNNEQEEAQEELEIEYDNEPVDIGFNVQYLQDLLNNVGTESVSCSLSDASSSLLMTLPGEENFRYVVMPMRI